MPKIVRKPTREEPEKGHRLSLAELAAHDDVCSDAMIDNAYFKSRIRKYRPKHIPLRGIKEDDVPQILLHNVIVGKDPVAAEKALLKLQGLKRYRSGLRSRIEQENFLSHLRKYIHMYMTDCAWEVSTTNRYTITTYEAAVTARRRIKQGEVIKYLTGTLVPLTTEQSTDLDLTNRNFSIVVSSRKKISSIFLGPARFANHDCDANGRLVTKGNEGMEVVAMKNIEIGDEITVSYGEDYFGPGNMDCLCHTCEALERNGWTSKEVFANPSSRGSTPALEPPVIPSRLSKKRKHDAETTLRTSASPFGKKLKTQTSPSKLQHSWTPPSSSNSDIVKVNNGLHESSEPDVEVVPIAVNELAISPPNSPDHRMSNSSAAIPAMKEDSTMQKPVDFPPRNTPQNEVNSLPSSTFDEGEHSPKVDRVSASLFPNSSSQSALPVTPASTTPTGHGNAEIDGEIGDTITSLPMETVTVKLESVETSKIEGDGLVVGTSLPYVETQSNELGVNSEETDSDLLGGFPEPKAANAQAITNVEITKVSQTIEPPVDSTNETIILPSIEPNTISATVAKVMIHPISDYIRIPGDYILTRKLLAQPHDRWVQCHNANCYGFFIQPNGYQTRRECPRCERHSMLYGFPWPKTDPDQRKLLERKKEQAGRGRKGALAEEYSPYRRHGRCGKGTWVEGGGDEEERVMDHRIVHRFVLPEEEKELTRKGLLREAEEARAKGEERLSNFEARRSRIGATESVGRDTSENGSATPDELRRRSNRFVPNRVYAAY